MQQQSLDATLRLNSELFVSLPIKFSGRFFQGFLKISVNFETNLSITLDYSSPYSRITCSITLDYSADYPRVTSADVLSITLDYSERLQLD